MTKESLVSQRRPRSAHTTSRSSAEAIDGSPSAEEIERIVDVAEVLKIDPQFARMALESGNEAVSTDCSLSRSVAIVEERLAPGR